MIVVIYFFVILSFMLCYNLMYELIICYIYINKKVDFNSVYFEGVMVDNVEIDIFQEFFFIGFRRFYFWDFYFFF